LSTLDLVRDGRHLLLTGPDGHGWALTAREADPAGARLDVALLPGGTGRFGIGTDGALLVRSDHVVAWRSPRRPSWREAREALGAVVEHVRA
jgi:putative polyketide hydroxylase